MRNALLVALREYVENAKTRGFWISIFMLPVMLFLSFQVPVLLEKRGAPVRHFVLVDLSGKFERTVLAALENNYQRSVLEALNEYARANSAATQTASPIWRKFADLGPEGVDRFLQQGGKDSYLKQILSSVEPGAPDFEEPRRRSELVPLPVTGTNMEEIIAALRPWLRGEKLVDFGGRQVRLDAAIIIPENIEQLVIRPGTGLGSSPPASGIQYWSANLTDKSLRNIIETALNQEVRRRESVARGLDLRTYQEIEQTHLPVLELNPKKEAGQERVNAAETFAQWAPVGFVYLLWIAIFSISQMLLSNTIEEKSNRIIEVLLSSITPGEFVIGKLAGIAAVGLTTIFAWILSLFLIVSWKTGHSEIATQAVRMLRSSHLIPAFVIYFIFGYLLYAGIILAIGSVCNTIKEAQNYMGVVTLLMMVPLLTMMFIPKDPNGPLATALSWIPLYTPFVMMNRAAADPPLLDLIGTMLLLIATCILVLWGAVKIFRTGILRTGQPPRVIEMLRWLRS